MAHIVNHWRELTRGFWAWIPPLFNLDLPVWLLDLLIFFFTGVAVSFTFVGELDFRFWFVYKKDMGTILPSALIVEMIIC